MSTKYQKILDDLERDIINGKYNEIKKLPKEEELINMYDVSRTTVRKAISILVNKGYVYQVQGSGIFLREAALKGYVSLENLRGLTRNYPNKKIESKIIKLSLIEAPDFVSEKMKIEIGKPVYFLERLRIVDNESFAIEYTYFNKKVIPYLNEDIAKKSIYSYIIDDLGMTIGFADRVIYADKLNKNDARVLELNENDPALIIDSVEFIGTGEVFAVSKTIHNYKNTKLLKLSNF